MAESREEYLARINSTNSSSQPIPGGVCSYLGCSKPARKGDQWCSASHSRRGQELERKRAKNQTVPSSGGTPTCSKCGGTQFKAKRKTSTKVMFGVASLAGKAQHVECVVCGTMYKRG
jgi:hypothetical protein